jgi:ribosomal protein L18
VYLQLRKDSYVIADSNTLRDGKDAGQKIIHCLVKNEWNKVVYDLAGRQFHGRIATVLKPIQEALRK